LQLNQLLDQLEIDQVHSCPEGSKAAFIVIIPDVNLLVKSSPW